MTLKKYLKFIDSNRFIDCSSEQKYNRVRKALIRRHMKNIFHHHMQSIQYPIQEESFLIFITILQSDFFLTYSLTISPNDT